MLLSSFNFQHVMNDIFVMQNNVNKLLYYILSSRLLKICTDLLLFHIQNLDSIYKEGIPLFILSKIKVFFSFKVYYITFITFELGSMDSYIYIKTLNNNNKKNKIKGTLKTKTKLLIITKYELYSYEVEAMNCFFNFSHYCKIISQKKGSYKTKSFLMYSIYKLELLNSWLIYIFISYFTRR